MVSAIIINCNCIFIICQMMQILYQSTYSSILIAHRVALNSALFSCIFHHIKLLLPNDEHTFFYIVFNINQPSDILLSWINQKITETFAAANFRKDFSLTKYYPLDCYLQNKHTPHLSLSNSFLFGSLKSKHKIKWYIKYIYVVNEITFPNFLLIIKLSYIALQFGFNNICY